MRAGSADGYRERVRGMWSEVAPAWEERADALDDRGRGLAERLLTAAGVGPGMRVLELACGPGGVGLEAARRVGPAGRVVLSDLSPEMTAVAARRAGAAGLAHVDARPLDLQRIDEPDGAYDAVVCREGLMFAADPPGALGEMGRVLRPDGRLAVSVWGPADRNPWLAIVFGAFARVTGGVVPPPGVPGPFSLGDPGRLRSAAAAAGLADVTVEEVPVPLRVPSAGAWWDQVTVLAGPLAGRLAALPDTVRRAVREAAVTEVRTRAEPAGDGLVVPGVALLLAARRPE